MEIFRELTALQRKKNCVITTGTFDGVHCGHRSIIQKLHEIARQEAGCTTIVTFEPHPQFVIKQHKKTNLKLLTTSDEKIAEFELLNIDRLIILTFDSAFARLSSREFIENILVKKIGFKNIIIGYDHAFGRDRQGNQEILEELSQTYHYSIIVVPPFSMDGVVISSTRIRNLLGSGDVGSAAKFLGRPYRISGSVIPGEGRGRTLNVPTANIKPNSADKLIPGDGIYAVWARLNDQKLKGVLYIGSKPTFQFSERSIELNIFDFTGDLYGQSIEIEFVAKIRDDYHFDKVEHLVKQIELDKQKTLEILTNHLN